ncbi:hypothetical protein JI750_00515 [Flavobacterium sp. GN10]|uniref:DUF4595 domain-containing protein n=1 Tax=Flavobacterium tagetis TaxID=2801336 RepID=A0ABS1K7S5_9FLAO|nr:hypothetical protein [Flavobacterium tagetis]MBL0735353.1 hypothetical protein [Flavobacterium tagetis]
MKKRFCYLLFVITGVISSCSNDIETSPKPLPTQSDLPKAISYKMGTYEYNNGDMVNIGFYDQVNTFNLNGNKILSISCPYGADVMKTVFTYTGNLITKAEGFTFNNLSGRTLYTYENGKLKTLTYLSIHNGLADPVFKLVYAHNTDGTISYKTFRGGSQEAEDGIVVLSFKNGNLVKKYTEYTVAPFYNYTYEYKYDNKNNPLKNILGLSLIALEGTLLFGHDMAHGDFGITDFGSNNVVEKITTIASAPNDISVYKEYLNYVYNVNGFPLNKTSTDDAQDDVTFTYQ